MSVVADEWLAARNTVKRRTRESDESNWRLHVAPHFGRKPVASITASEVSSWMGRLISSGASPSSVNRYLATLRSVLAHAVADQRVTTNVAATVKPPSGSHARREARFLSLGAAAVST